MQAKENPSNDDFTSQIENAIDNLFSAKRDIVIDPSTNEVIDQEALGRKGSSDGSFSKKTPLKSGTNISHPSVSRADAKRIEEDPTILLEKLNQSFLTIDWEISEKNVNTFQELLSQLQKVLNYPSNTDEGLILHLMEQVLSSMAKSAMNVPASAMHALQKGLVYIQEVIDRSPQAKKEVAELSAATINALRNSLPQISLTSSPKEEEEIFEDEDLDLGDLEEALAQESIVGEILDSNSIPSAPTFRLPSEISNSINLHLSLLAQAINQILPLEEQFSRSARLQKLLEAHQEIRIQLEEQKDILSSALGTNYSSAKLIADTNVPEPLGRLMKDQIQILDQSARRMASMAKTFQKTKGYEKLFSVAQNLREQFIDMGKSLAVLLKLQREEMKNVPQKEELSEGLVDTFQTHVSVLSKCIKQVLSIETLFDGRRGYEKLFTAHQRLRMQLESQKDLLDKALEGDYFVLPAAPPPLDLKDEVKNIPCPWPKLVQGQWLGKSVAFIPEQIAFQGPAPRWALKLYQSGLSSIPLRKLKSWPWSKIFKLFSGDLAKLNDNELSGLELPILSPPREHFSPATKTGKETLLILYREKQGGIILLDTPATPLEVGHDNQWESIGNIHYSFVDGYLKTMFDTIPVLNITKV